MHFAFPKVRITEIGSLGGAIIGSALIAWNLGLNQIGYMFFLVSSICSVKLLLESNASKALLLQTIYFTIINIVGILRWAT